MTKYRIKPGKLQIWLDWSKELNQRRAEALETLRAEAVFSEACFLSTDKKFVYMVMEADDLTQAHKAGQTSSFPIDASHKAKRMASLEFVERVQLLYHFETISDLQSRYKS